jgi:alpha-1,2-mannosyltransferase
MPTAVAPARTAPGPSPDPALSRLEWCGLVLLALAFVVFGFVVEFRSAFLHRRMGDLEVFLRAAWAVRSGDDLYTTTDSKGFHYHYPPLFAILLTPFADPPRADLAAWRVPYPLTVACWYVLSVALLAVGVHWLATTVEETGPGGALTRPVRGRRRWWQLRVFPVLACLPAVGSCLGRGQVSILLVFLLCGLTVAVLRGRSGQAGLWLAAAICLKVIPAYLLVYPLYRRDGRCLAGCAAGLVLSLAIVPAVVFGPVRTLSYYAEWNDVLVRPVLGVGHDRSRARELLEVTGTDSQSFLAAFHNTMHRDRATRPVQASAAVEALHWLCGALLTLLTLRAGRGRQHDSRVALRTLGSLIVLNHLVSPVCHLHYLCVAVPLVMGLLTASWDRAGGARLGTGTVLVLGANVVAGALPHFPGLEVVRDSGLAMYGAVLLWASATWSLGPRRSIALRPSVAAAAPRGREFVLAVNGAR